MIFNGYLNRLRNVSLENELDVGAPLNVVAPDVEPTRAVSIQRDAPGALQHHFELDHIMTPLALSEPSSSTSQNKPPKDSREVSPCTVIVQ